MTPPNDPSLPTTSEPSSLSPEVEGQPARIGPYRIVGLLGRGGMGAVYLAEQTEPVRREVAIKLLTTGVDSEIFAARFDAERQTLALMQHPNITNVYDAGVSDAGLPYFVMERVSGTTLLEFCDARRLGVKARIDLFRQICRAVQHAHQKGIVHRDLKPSNVIVTEADGKPVCKVIDFGIAKTIGGVEGGQADDDRHLTGTPAYMSPEQARGDADVDTRADVYSLGVTLYELLAGVLPFESKSSFAMMMATQHGDASAPSQRLHHCRPKSKQRSPSGGALTRRRYATNFAKTSIGSCSKSIERDRELRLPQRQRARGRSGAAFRQPAGIGRSAKRRVSRAEVRSAPPARRRVRGDDGGAARRVLHLRRGPGAAHRDGERRRRAAARAGGRAHRVHARRSSHSIDSRSAGSSCSMKSARRRWTISPPCRRRS